MLSKDSLWTEWSILHVNCNTCVSNIAETGTAILEGRNGAVVIILSTSYCLTYMSNMHGCWGNPCDFYLESNRHTQILKASKGNVHMFGRMHWNMHCIFSVSLHALKQPPQLLKIWLFCISCGAVRENFLQQVSSLTFSNAAPTKGLSNRAVWSDLITACRQSGY